MQKLAFLFIIFSIHSTIAQFPNATDPRLRIRFWLEHYTQVTDGPEYELAMSVFQNILAVSDKPVGVLPTLYVFSDIEFNQLFATRDGGIIMPIKVIEFCQKNKRITEDRLAFLIGHEIKHIVRGDYELIHALLQFIQSIGGQSPTKNFSHIWERVQWGPSLDSRKAIELQADEYGILYLMLAGYDVESIVSFKHNFISEYYRFANIDEYGGLSHPSGKERIRVIENRMSTILKNRVLFECALKFYAIGACEESIALLSEFVRLFPSREVFNNRGMCFYQNALSLFAKWKPGEVEENPNFVFKLSAQIDPVSRARVATRAIHSQYEHQVLKAINQAITDFKEAERLDARYPVIYNNLGCAHLLKGELEFAKGYFKKAIGLNQSYKEAYNNLGVCYIADEDGEQAKNAFLDASRISPTYADPFYNLGQLYTVVGRKDEASEYLKRYLQLDKTSGYAQKARVLLGISLPSQSVPNFGERIDQITPKNLPSFGDRWQTFHMQHAEVSVFTDEKKGLGYCFYRHNQPDKTIGMVWTGKGYSGQSAKSIQIGDPDELVRIRYPFRSKEVPTSQGAFWVYKDLGLVYEMRYGKVNGWFLFNVF